MSLSLFAVSVPVFVRRLHEHVVILDKARAHAEAQKIDPLTLLDDRLYPDMFPFWLQVHSACNHAANATARLTGAPLPVFDETPKTFEGLKERSDTVEAYDQMIGEGNEAGNAAVQGGIDALIAQTRGIERAVALLKLDVQVEGSDSLDNPDAVFQ